MHPYTYIIRDAYYAMLINPSFSSIYQLALDDEVHLICEIMRFTDFLCGYSGCHPPTDFNTAPKPQAAIPSLDPYTVEPLNRGTLGLIVSSLAERLSLSQRVPYRRL